VQPFDESPPSGASLRQLPHAPLQPATGSEMQNAGRPDAGQEPSLADKARRATVQLPLAAITTTDKGIKKAPRRSGKKRRHTAVTATDHEALDVAVKASRRDTPRAGTPVNMSAAGPAAAADAAVLDAVTAGPPLGENKA
jgi:hypothetical protein